MRILIEYPFLRYFLPAYFVAFALVCYVFKTTSFRKKYHADPLVEGKADNLQNTIGFYKLIILVTGLLTILLYSLFPRYYRLVVPFEYLETGFMKSAGIFLLLFSLVFTRYSQDQLRHSWRIGVNRSEKTQLITTGIYKWSRNPIAFGMLLMLAGFFCVIPNAISFASLCSGVVIADIRIQIEEDHLTKTLGKEYEDYRKRTRKWI